MSRLPANPIFYQTNVLAPTLNYQPSMGRHNAFAGQHRGFHTSSLVLEGQVFNEPY